MGVRNLLLGWEPTGVSPQAPPPARRPESPRAWPPASNPPGGYLAPFTVPFVDELAAFPVSRDVAWQVPACAQGIQVIAGTTGTFPLVRYRRVLDAEGVLVRLQRLATTSLLDQPDPDEPREATVTRLVEDLVLHPQAFALILDRAADGFPSSMRYVQAELVEPRVNARGDEGFQVDQDWWPAREVIVFESHWPGLLIAGASAVRTAALLERAARRYANDNAPAGALKNTGADLPPDKVDELLSTWEASRRTRTTGYLNAQVAYERYSWSSSDLELVAGRQWQTSEVGRLLNLPPRYLNAPAGASMDYANITSERRDLVDLSLAPYIASVQGRLSMPDVTPRGQVVRFDLTDFYSGDLAEQVTTYSTAVAAGLMTVDEARIALRLAPLGGA